MKVDPIVGINDILSNLCSQNQHIKGENGLPTVSYGQNLNSNSDSNVLHADLINGDDGFDDDDGWEFKGVISENSKIQVGSRLLGLEVETTIKQEMQENSNGDKYTSGFRNGLDSYKDFFAAPNGLWQENSERAKHIEGKGSKILYLESSMLWLDALFHVLWYRPLYRAMRTNSALNFVIDRHYLIN